MAPHYPNLESRILNATFIETFSNLRDGVKKLEVVENSVKKGYSCNLGRLQMFNSSPLISSKVPSLATSTMPCFFSPKLLPEVKRLPVLYGLTNPPINLASTSFHIKEATEKPTKRSSSDSLDSDIIETQDEAEGQKSPRPNEEKKKFFFA